MFLIKLCLQLSHSLQILLCDHIVKFLILGHSLFSFGFLLEKCCSKFTLVSLLYLFLKRSKFLKWRNWAIFELLVDLGLHLRLSLDFESSYCLSWVFSGKVILSHLFILSASDEALIFSKVLSWKLYELELSISFHQKLLVSFNYVTINEHIIVFFHTSRQLFKSIPSGRLVNPLVLPLFYILEHLN